jgi:hypothetical protein
MSLFQSPGDDGDDVEMNQGGRIRPDENATSREEKSSRNVVRGPGSFAQPQTPYDPETRPLRSSS